MSWNGKLEWEGVQQGLDVMFEAGKRHAVQEWRRGFRTMDGWIAENALDKSFAAGYVLEWKHLAEFASLGLSAEAVNQ